MNPIKNIPTELLERAQWVIWRQEKRNGRPTKVPYCPVTRKKARCNDPKTWGTFEQAQNAMTEGNYDGLGFALSQNDPFVGIDLDHAVDNDGKIRPWAQEIIERMDSYTEFSPSGKGIHILVKCTKPGDRCRAKCHDGEVEMYSQNRYFTVTGNSLDTPPKAIIDRQSPLEQVYRMVFGKEKIQQSPSKPLALKVVNISAEELIRKISNSKNGNRFRKLWAGDWSDYPSQSEADMALCDILAYYVGNDPERIDKLFRQSGLYRKKWERADYSELTISKAITATRGCYSQRSTIASEVKFDNMTNIENEKLELFPDIMSGLAGDFAKLYSSYLEVPAHFFYMAFMTALGSVLADRLTLASEIAPQPRLYTILLGESADDRKSTAIDKTIEFFEPAGVGLWVCLGVNSAEGLQRIMKESPRLLLCVDEMKQFVSKCKIESSVLLPCVNTLFEANQYEAQTKSSGVCLDDAYLSFLGASTVQTYEHMWDSSFTDIGFNNRLFLVPGSGEKKFSLPVKVPESEKRLLMNRLQQMVNGIGPRLELKIDPEARKKYHSWYMGMDRSVHSKRLDTYASRLMSLLAVNELKREVDVETINKAIALSDWQLEVRRQHDPIDAENTVAKMEEKIRRVLATGMKTERELKQKTNANRTGLWCYRMAKDNLLKAKEIAWKSKKLKLV